MSNLDRLREVAARCRDRIPRAPCGRRRLRTARRQAARADLLTGFAATRNEGGFRVHCTRAVEAGATLAEIEHVVLLMLGTSLGLAPAVEALHWAQDELGHLS